MPRILIEDPRDVKSSTDMLLPSFVNPYTDNTDPSRQKDRQDIADPQVAKSKAEIADPRREAPKIDIVEPKRARALMDIPDSIDTKSSTEREEPSLETPYTDTLLAHLNTARSERPDPRW
jgi:hypothetical protein